MLGNLKTLVDSHGPEKVRDMAIHALHEGKVDPRDFSIRELWEAFVGPCGQTLEAAQTRRGFVQMSDAELADAATGSSAFADITGEVLTAQVLEAYNQQGYIGDRLFRERSSSRRKERAPGFVLQDETTEIQEAEPYREAGMRDRYVDFESGNKRGLLLSITEEAIFFDETGELLDRAARIGQFVRDDKESRQLDVFTDTTGRYYPDGTSTTVYSSGNGNLTTSNGLTDWSNIESCLQTIKDQTDPEGRRIVVPINKLIIPWALLGTASHIVNASAVTEITNSNARETEARNPLQALLGSIPELVTSPRLDDYSGTTWYMGAPLRALLYRVHWPLQTFRRRRDTEEGWNRDIVWQMKVREWGTAHWRDHRYVYQNTK